MTIKIGDASYTTRKPANLDDVLLADLGCNAAEVGRIVSGSPLAGTVARALRPFLAEDGRPSVTDLAGAIDAAGTLNVARDVAALYGASDASAKPAPDAPAKPGPDAPK